MNFEPKYATTTPIDFRIEGGSSVRTTTLRIAPTQESQLSVYRSLPRAERRKVDRAAKRIVKRRAKGK